MHGGFCAAEGKAVSDEADVSGFFELRHAVCRCKAVSQVVDARLIRNVAIRIRAVFAPFTTCFADGPRAWDMTPSTSKDALCNKALTGRVRSSAVG